jgi:macrolide-specific efflux system membrane fusion protein
MKWMAATAGAAVIALVAVIWLARGGTSADNLRAVPVTVGQVEDTVETTGSVEPLTRIVVSPPIAGRIEDLLVEEGSRVKAGDVVAWMSSADRAAILDAARVQGPDELKTWEASYRPTSIVAPYSGVVILSSVVVGQSVNTSSVVYAISDELIVVAAVDESDIGRVRVGMSARVTLDAYPDRVTTGRVLRILYEGKNVSNVITYGVKIKLDRVPFYYRSQMSANIILVASKDEKAVLVPESAVRPGRRGESMVLVPGPRGRPVPRPVTTGVELDGRIQVTSGLEPGDTVYITPRRYVRQRGIQGSPLTPGRAPGEGSGGRHGGGNPGH